MSHWLDCYNTPEQLQWIISHSLATYSVKAAAQDKIRAIYAGTGNSWSYSKYLSGEDQESEQVTYPHYKPREKICRCESHYLFCWGHENNCDYYEGDK